MKDHVGVCSSADDVARAKLRASRLRNLQFVRGNMARCTFEQAVLLRRCRVSRFSTFVTPNDQQSCLLHVREHLRPKDRLIVHLFDPKLEFCTPTNTAAVPNAPLFATEHWARTCALRLPTGITIGSRRRFLKCGGGRSAEAHRRSHLRCRPAVPVDVSV